MLAHSHPSLFKTDPYLSFFKAFKKYASDMGYKEIDFPDDDELEQLSWYMASTVVSPEARGVNPYDPLHFEIKRSFARRMSFELLLIGDPDSYLQFIADQADPISLGDFIELSNEAKSLSNDIKTVIRISCLLTKTEKATERFDLLLAGNRQAHTKLVQNQLILINYDTYLKHADAARELLPTLKDNKLSSDSEEFLTQLGILMTSRQLQKLLPAARRLTTNQAALLEKIYWPNTHLRHMLQTEGADNMTKSFNEGIANGKFTHDAYLAWKWRWLTGSFGFQPGKGAKYYDKNVHMLTMMVTSKLEKSFTLNPQYSYLDGYLNERAKLAGLDGNITAEEQYFLGHLAAYCNKVQIIDKITGAIIRSAYEAYKLEAQDNGSLARNYHEVRKDTSSITPTYVTSTYSSAYDIHYKHLTAAGTPAEAAQALALKGSTIFICHVLASLFTVGLKNRVSMQKLADEKTLRPTYLDWLAHPKAWEFKLNSTHEMIATKLEELEAKPESTFRLSR